MKDTVKSRRLLTGDSFRAKKNLRFETGSLSTEEVEALLNSIPLDLTYVGGDDTLKYCNRSTVSVFDRSPEILGGTVEK